MVFDFLGSHFESIEVVVFNGRNSFGFETFIDIDAGSVIDVVLHLLEEEGVDGA